MKCIQCGTDNNLKDRTANHGRCKSCNHSFAFEPTGTTEKITDSFFNKALTDISANQTLFFTAKQFTYLLNKRFKKFRSSIVFIYFFMNIWATLFFGGFISAIFSVRSSVPFFVALFLVNCIFITALSKQSQSAQYSQTDRRKVAKFLLGIGGFILLGITGGIFLIRESITFFFVAISAFIFLGMTAIAVGIWQLKRQKQIPQVLSLDTAQVRDWLFRWERANGKVAKLLALAQAGNGTVNSDITHYSFDRLVVCDSAAIAQLLIANNFHFENNCAVLSITGYPSSIFGTVMEMLRRNPDLKVYVIHDCSPKGLQVIHQLKTNSKWFQDQDVTIVDTGLLPRQIFQGRDVFICQSSDSAQAAKQLPAEIRQHFSAAELQWLDAGFFVELESFTPQKLIQVLNRGIAGSRELINTDDSSLLIIGGDTNYAMDSFG